LRFDERLRPQHGQRIRELCSRSQSRGSWPTNDRHLAHHTRYRFRDARGKTGNFLHGLFQLLEGRETEHVFGERLAPLGMPIAVKAVAT
jgi:hypothetical protein